MNQYKKKDFNFIYLFSLNIFSSIMTHPSFLAWMILWFYLLNLIFFFSWIEFSFSVYWIVVFFLHISFSLYHRFVLFSSQIHLSMLSLFLCEIFVGIADQLNRLYNVFFSLFLWIGIAPFLCIGARFARIVRILMDFKMTI